MPTITTTRHSNWYEAQASTGHSAIEPSRQAAFMMVARELANAGYYKF